MPQPPAKMAAQPAPLGVLTLVETIQFVGAQVFSTALPLLFLTLCPFFQNFYQVCLQNKARI